jgi:phosphodiesterase/alkaline phosphatase D-like protein
VLTGLSPLTTYYYRVVSRDEAGNVKLGSGKTFTTR